MIYSYNAVLLTHILTVPFSLYSFKPLKLRTVLIVYNLAMACLNFHIFKELITNAWHLNYNYWCQPCRIIYSKHEIKVSVHTYNYGLTSKSFQKMFRLYVVGCSSLVVLFLQTIGIFRYDIFHCKAQMESVDITAYFPSQYYVSNMVDCY